MRAREKGRRWRRQRREEERRTRKKKKKEEEDGSYEEKKKERKGKWGRKMKMSGKKSSLKRRKDNKIMKLPKYP